MIRLLFIALALGCSVVASVRADSYHTALDPSARGGIVGKVEPAEGLQTVIAIEPFAIKAYQGRVDASTGVFEFHGLPAGEYDLLIKTVGHVYEGMTLEVDEEPPVAEPARILGEIKPMFFESEDYFNVKKIVRLTGTATHARMLVVQTRTRPTLDPAGDTIKANIRRFDLVDLLKTHKAWQIVTSRHLLRQEVPYGTADIKIEFTHSPKLGGILVGEQVKDLGTLDLKKLPAGAAGKYVGASIGSE